MYDTRKLDEIHLDIADDGVSIENLEREVKIEVSNIR
jgi:hypothetical protein